MDGRFQRMERSSGYFVRRIQCPALIDKDRIREEHRDGVLKIILPTAKSLG